MPSRCCCASGRWGAIDLRCPRRCDTAMGAWALPGITEWLPSDSVAGGLAILALAVTLGLAIGGIRVRGVRLGIAGVLFSALVFGQLGLTVDAKVLGFLRDFALILFMYTVGLQVGPGFLSSLRAEGLRLNMLAVITLL